MRRGAGVVERGGLENRCAFMGTEGSNPSLSAKSELQAFMFHLLSHCRVLFVYENNLGNWVSVSLKGIK